MSSPRTKFNRYGEYGVAKYELGLSSYLVQITITAVIDNLDSDVCTILDTRDTSCVEVNGETESSRLLVSEIVDSRGEVVEAGRVLCS